MHRHRSAKGSTKVGLPPGALVHVGERRAEVVTVSVFRYSETEFSEEQVPLDADLTLPKPGSGVVWISVDGLHETEALGRLGERLGLHPLIVEDILNTEQRPKADDLGDYIFVVLKWLHDRARASAGLEVEQISLVLGPSHVLTFQERPSALFDPVRDRIRNNRGRVRKMGADYLAYLLIDAVVDDYFVALERLGERVELLEDEVVTRPTTETLRAIQQLRRETMFARRSLWPTREVLGALERRESPLIRETTEIYLRDAYDHTIQVIDAVETLRDTLTEMLDIYLSSLSNRMNEVMKVLTIIATVFIPLTFIVGLYGMNFEYMPELNWRWSYPIIWLVMIVVAALMVAYFRRKKWL